MHDEVVLVTGGSGFVGTHCILHQAFGRLPRANHGAFLCAGSGCACDAQSRGCPTSRSTLVCSS